MRQDNWNIEQLRQSLDRKIAGTEELIRKGLEEAKKDYSRFFEWQADDVYKAGRLRDYYGVFRNKVNGTDDVEELQRYFKDIEDTSRKGCLPIRPQGTAPARWRTWRIPCHWNACKG